MADRFYTPQPLTPGEFSLDGAEAHHLATVRRFEPGDPVVLFNGSGSEFPAIILGISRSAVSLLIGGSHSPDRELGFPLIVASALPKGDRADFLVEKLVELGATRFVPLIAERSVVIPKSSAVAKFERAMIEACKQCGRNVIPAVEEPQTCERFFAQVGLPETRLILHTDNGEPLSHLAPERIQPGVAVAVGPEGGFTSGELATARERNWLPVSLGPRILRVETAAIAAIVHLSALAERPSGPRFDSL